MSLKTLTEEFGKAEEKLTSPFDFEDGVTILAVPEPMISEIAQGAEKPEGTTLQLPNIPNTKTVQVHQAPDLFKGELPHLPKEEHEAVIDWFDKASVDPQTPAEVRMYMLEIVMKLKSDAIKRIPDESPVQEGLFRGALEKVGLVQPEPIIPGAVPDVRVNPDYKISVDILREGKWITGLQFVQETPLSRSGIEKLVAKTKANVSSLMPKPSAVRILQNDNPIHEETI